MENWAILTSIQSVSKIVEVFVFGIVSLPILFKLFTNKSQLNDLSTSEINSLYTCRSNKIKCTKSFSLVWLKLDVGVIEIKKVLLFQHNMSKIKILRVRYVFRLNLKK